MALPISALPKRIHLIGIGGDGMGALAAYLADGGFDVSGSDLQISPVLTDLIQRGLRIDTGHDEKHLRGVECVVVSDAVLNTNCEVVEARLRDLPILTRAQCLAFLAKEKESIYIAGAHGKTTTGAILAHLLHAWNSSTSFILGANVSSLGNCRAQWHAGLYLVAEACEAFGNLTPLYPNHLVLTNIDDEHLNHYGSQSRLDRSYMQLMSRTARGGSIVFNGDDPGIMRVLSSDMQKTCQNAQVTLTSVGFERNNQVQILHYQWHDTIAQFDLIFPNQNIVRLQLPVPGLHNAINASLAVVMAHHLGMPMDAVQEGLRSFGGVERRWQDHGVIADVRLIDDYAHHPAELNALFSTAKTILGDTVKKVLIYQPQLISRTKRVLEQTASSLAQWDEVLLLEIDPAGEANPERFSSAELGESVAKSGGVVKYFEDVNDVVNRFDRYIQAGDAVIIAGAGQIRRLAPSLKAQLINFIDRKHFGSIESAPISTQVISRRIGLFSKIAKTLHELLGQLRWYAFRITSSKVVANLFEWHLRHRPDEVVLMTCRGNLTYEQLDCYAKRLATQFYESGVRPGDVVGVHLHSCAALVASVLALHKLGAIYLPLDTQLPVARLFNLLQLSSSRFLISKRGSDIFMKMPQTIICLQVDAFESIDAMLTDESTLKPLPSKQLSPKDLAYICFTSGTTGTPKGVPITHGALHNLVKQLIGRLSISKSSRTIINTGIGFDVSLAELWLSLAGGGRVVVTDQDHVLVGPRLADFIEEMKVSHAAMTPSVLRTVPQRPFPDWKCVVLAGEVCTQELVNQWATQNRKVWNAYGPTETAIYATLTQCQAQTEVTIGKPLSGVHVYVVNEQNQELMPGFEGELLIGGKGVSPGYLSGVDLASPSFIPWMENGQAVDWVYRTGDRVRGCKDGKFIYLGRMDAQIKLNGVRIELGEIESVLRKQKGITDAIVALDTHHHGEQLIAFVMPEPGTKPAVESIRKHLIEILPKAMIPDEILLIGQIPLTLSGKVDRQQLIDQRRSLSIVRPFFDPGRSEMEKDLVRIWERVLQYQPIGIYDEFFTLGGDSLKTLLLQDELETVFQVELPSGFLADLRNITNLAVKLNEYIDSYTHGQNQSNQPIENPRLYHQIYEITSTWRARSHGPGALIRSLGEESASHDLFVCLQYEEELTQMHEALGSDFRVHGMRSGHLVMTYTPENVAQLATRYIEEFKQIAPSGNLIIAGICQGGAIAHAMAMSLYKEQGILLPLVFIEQARFPKYPGMTHFFYSGNSFLNPMNKFHGDLSRFDEIYHDGYTFDVIPGEHGSITRMPFAQDFAIKFKRYFDHRNLKQLRMNAKTSSVII